jgi:hypothetical protein
MFILLNHFGHIADLLSYTQVAANLFESSLNVTYGADIRGDVPDWTIYGPKRYRPAGLPHAYFYSLSEVGREEAQVKDGLAGCARAGAGPPAD